ncbi:MAG: helix-turn-helix transcriptional regulator [Clostridia bacterium]|nr:helix-turn-helix transcriptional regulator [Clostridia bacterium]
MLSEYGKILRKVRIDSGELLNDMAVKLGVSPALLSYIENGKREIPQGLTETAITRYNLASGLAEQLRAAETQSKKMVKVELSPSVSVEKRQTALLFARTFNNMNDDVLAKIRVLLEGEDG